MNIKQRIKDAIVDNIAELRDAHIARTLLILADVIEDVCDSPRPWTYKDLVAGLREHADRIKPREEANYVKDKRREV